MTITAMAIADLKYSLRVIDLALNFLPSGADASYRNRNSLNKQHSSADMVMANNA